MDNVEISLIELQQLLFEASVALQDDLDKNWELSKRIHDLAESKIQITDVEHPYMDRLLAEYLKLEESVIRLLVVTNMTIEQLTEYFMAGYTLVRPNFLNAISFNKINNISKS